MYLKIKFRWFKVSENSRHLRVCDQFDPHTQRIVADQSFHIPLTAAIRKDLFYAYDIDVSDIERRLTSFRLAFSRHPQHVMYPLEWISTIVNQCKGRVISCGYLPSSSMHDLQQRWPHGNCIGSRIVWWQLGQTYRSGTSITRWLFDLVILYSVRLFTLLQLRRRIVMKSISRYAFIVISDLMKIPITRSNTR